LNKYVQVISNKLVAGGCSLGSAILVTSIYCLIRCQKTLDTVFAVFVALLVLLVVGIIILLVSKAIEIRFISENVRLKFQYIHYSTNMEQFRFWKSCYPLNIQVGSVGSIETHDFLIIFLETILKSTVNLLLNF